MPETLGSLLDKLTIVKLKQWHTEAPDRLNALAAQEKQLQEEINQFVADVRAGAIPKERLTFAANKVYKKEGNTAAEAQGSIGALFAQLTIANCNVWHTQEKVYAFESVPPAEKDAVIKQLAIYNLERNNCIDQIDREFQALVSKA